MKLPKLILISTLACIPITLSAEHTCNYAKIKWQDAALHSRSPNPDFDRFQTLLVPQVSFGCAEIQDNVVMVVYNFSGGEPDCFLAT